jgi:hypothetical protein
MVLSPEEYTRIANNFYNSKGLDSDISRIALDSELANFVSQSTSLPKSKVAFVFICLNPLYWEFTSKMVEGAKKFFLPGHQTDFFFWTDIPESEEEIRTKMTLEFQKTLGLDPKDHNLIYNDITIGQNYQTNLNKKILDVINLRKTANVTIVPTESVPWPMPTLMRYHLFLQQEQKLKEYDYIFYCDVDMEFVGVVGDEVLGSDLTAAPHPGYYIRKELYPPYEPNELSASYIPRPGKVEIEPNSISTTKKRFVPHYYAGGFQGGKAKDFIKAMKACKKLIDADTRVGYIPIWNDETAWNKYLFKNPPSVMLTPSYIYPDSLIKEYYEPIVWGRSFQPKLVTITKWFSLSAQGGEHIQSMLKK